MTPAGVLGTRLPMFRVTRRLAIGYAKLSWPPCGGAAQSALPPFTWFSVPDLTR
jgi:hypothetical protein